MSRMQISFGILLSIITGCTSFRTTALTRLDNDSVIPECRKCNKLNGLPVKLKVPSHVVVKIYEQQLILANSPDEKAAKQKTANESAADVKGRKSEIEAIVTNFAETTEALKAANISLDEATQNLNAAKEAMNQGEIVRFTEEVRRNTIALSEADAAFKAAEARSNELPGLNSKLAEAEHKAAIDLANTAVGYTLVSFTPAQLIVETDLEYTDKIFMVDFRRPAGGILDLSEASMDDEQYFSKIQAEVTERTMADVSSAIKTLQGPLSNGAKKAATNVATPTSASTPDGEQSNTINFQKSVVAFKRFDVSEPCWEERMMEFVNSRLGTSHSVPDAPYITDVSSHMDSTARFVDAEMPDESGMVTNGDLSDVGRTSSVNNFAPQSKVPAAPYSDFSNQTSIE
ncbi:MAG: hypothetical protein U0936_21460 [Planctomycetaceae bacterium]